MRSTIWAHSLYYIAATHAFLIDPDRFYKQEKLEKNVNIRILNYCVAAEENPHTHSKDWRPLGPSAATDDVMDEYKWGVDQAFKALRYSKWTFESASVVKAGKLFTSKNYDKSKDSIIIVHPVFSSANVFFVRTTVTALAMRNLHKKYNIFAIDMPWNNPQMLLSVFLIIIGKHTYFEPMARAVSRFLVEGVHEGLIRPEQIHLVGWSYSGQLVGYMARHIGGRYNTKIGSILALDPYYKLQNKDLYHVSRDDARAVHIFHTNTFVAGTREKLGTADFVFNNGIIQPECRGKALWKNTVKEANICSHMKAVQRLWYVILYPSKFVASRCPSWFSLKTCLCEGNGKVVMMYPIPLDSKAEGLYYLRTLGTKPYGVGKWGAMCSSEQRLLLKFTNEN